MMERRGIIAAGNMLVDHVHQIVQWPERGWLAEITHSERATGGAPLNVLLTLAKMRAGLRCRRSGWWETITTGITFSPCSTSITSTASGCSAPRLRPPPCHR
ncbi:Uncharacterised protein [Leclercia adecarboxylata]|uniref:Ribokinase n=1 Tax=Leclercia adecarboxylata TaxID=83655 RepID=A0A4U9HF66_9ENTR|nr:Uncharacterised protein [Leclercia adecarboxylata]